MSDLTPPVSGSAPAGGKPGFDAEHLAQEGKKVAAKAWEWTKKAAAFAWPKVKQGAKVVSEKVDHKMDEIIESVNHPEHKEVQPAAQPAPAVSVPPAPAETDVTPRTDTQA